MGNIHNGPTNYADRYKIEDVETLKREYEKKSIWRDNILQPDHPYTPFYKAIWFGRLKDVKIFVTQHDVNDSGVTLKEMLNQVMEYDIEKFTPLNLALDREQTEIVRYLLDHDEVDPTKRNTKGGMTPLHRALYYKTDIETVKLFLKSESVINAINATYVVFGENYLWTPLDKLYMSKNNSKIKKELVTLIRSHGGKAGFHNANGDCLRKWELQGPFYRSKPRSWYENLGDLYELQNAIKAQDLNLIQKLIDIETDAYLQYQGAHLLRLAIDTSNFDICKLLINNNRISDNEINGETILHYICGMSFNKSKEKEHLDLTKIIYEVTSATYRDNSGRDRFDLVRYTCTWPLVIKWAKSLGTKFQRYKIANEEEPIHQSSTSVVFFATDIKDNNKKVALKLMKNYDEFEREIISRFSDNNSQTMDTCVVKVLGWHLPNNENEPSTETNKRDYAIEENFQADKPYVLVLERGSKSLWQQLGTQRIAGYHPTSIINIFQQAVIKVKELHDLGYVHCDIKPRNCLYINRNGEEHLFLCDMDAACRKDSSPNETLKYSTGYCPPELARCIFTTNGKLEKMITAFDVWSLGVLLYELCTGQQLFHQDISNDNLVNEIDMNNLCAWHTIPDIYLNLVDFPNNQQMTEDARNLIRWCLKGNPSDRPALENILKHRFLDDENSAEPNEQLMKYHMFISHSQAEASGEVGTLYNALARLGIHVWRDMSQKNIDANSMIQGVIDSDVFVVMLTNSYMSRWYCLLEFATALLFDKPIMVIVEENPMFWQWDKKRWQENICSREADHEKAEERGWKSSMKFDANKKKLSTLQNTYEDLETKDMEFTKFSKLEGSSNNAKHIRDFITGMSDDNLMIPHRRRGFEYEAMLYELLLRANIEVPKREKSNFKRHSFMVIYAEQSTNKAGQSGKTIGTEVEESLQEKNQLIVSGIDAVEYIVVILTGGVLEDATCLLNLESIFTDRKDLVKNEKLIFIMSKLDGWVFYASETEKAANNETAKTIRNMMYGHEVMTYRPKGGNRNYEHESMIMEMMYRLNVEKKKDSVKKRLRKSTITRD